LDKLKWYLIKWVGSKVPTWIPETDFLQIDCKKEFHKYEANRNNLSLQKKAYIYCRTSRRNDGKEVSLYDQEKCCLQFAEKCNINIIGVYKDNGVSAKNMENQFALNFIIHNIKNGECILFYDVSRFSRSMNQAIEKLEYLRTKIGAIVHSVHDSITWNDIASNRHNFRQLLSTSQLYSEMVSEKVSSALQYRIDRGDHIGYVPYGFKTEIVKGVRILVRNNNEMDVIKKIFDLALDLFIDRFDDLNINNDDKINKSKKKKIYKKTQG